MTQETLTQEFMVPDALGLHIRPAATLARTARQYRAQVAVRYEEREANAESVLGILTLGVPRGAALTVLANGEDAAEAMAAIERMFAAGAGSESECN